MIEYNYSDLSYKSNKSSVNANAEELSILALQGSGKVLTESTNFVTRDWAEQLIDLSQNGGNGYVILRNRLNALLANARQKVTELGSELQTFGNTEEAPEKGESADSHLSPRRSPPSGVCEREVQEASDMTKNFPSLIQPRLDAFDRAWHQSVDAFQKTGHYIEDPALGQIIREFEPAVTLLDEKLQRIKKHVKNCAQQ